MARALAQFTITRTGDGNYTLHLEDEDGETLEYIADYDQLDEIGDAIDEQLEADEDALIDEEDDEEAVEDED